MRARRLTGAVRKRLGVGLSERAKLVALAWGWTTVRWRMQPSFLVVGAQRAGTTTLFRLLEEHPRLSRPTFVKGTSYFDVNYGHGRRWYLAHFPLRRRSSLMTFENSGYYLFHPLAAERIARDLPGVRVVAMLRDPVERAYSAHRHEKARGFDSLEFEAAVDAEQERLAGETERIRREPRYHSFEHRHHGYLARGRYAEQLEAYVQALGVDRVHVVDADDFFADPLGEFARLQRWLGLPVWLPESVERWNERPREPLPEDLRARLRDAFAVHDDLLTAHLGRPPSWRRVPTTPSHQEDL